MYEWLLVVVMYGRQSEVIVTERFVELQECQKIGKFVTSKDYRHRYNRHIYKGTGPQWICSEVKIRKAK